MTEVRTKTNRIRVFLADDHAVLRAGLKLLVSSQTDMEVCGEAGSGAEAVEKVASAKPDVVLMDLRMDGMDGIDATRGIANGPSAPRVLILSMYDDPAFMDLAFDAGASGYALKRDADAELLLAIRAVARGDSYLAPSLTAALLKRMRGEELSGPSADPVLSTREMEVLKQLALGHTNRQVAEALGLSVKTVETYKARLMGKLEVQGRVGLVRYALSAGLLRGQE